MTSGRQAIGKAPGVMASHVVGVFLILASLLVAGLPALSLDERGSGSASTDGAVVEQNKGSGGAPSLLAPANLEQNKGSGNAPSLLAPANLEQNKGTGNAPSLLAPANNSNQLDAGADPDDVTPPPWVRRLPAFLRPDLNNTSAVHRPVLAFRRWARYPKPFVPTFLLLFFTGLLGSAFFRTQVNIAQECCKVSFWRCLGRAFVVMTTAGIAIRVLILLQITEPLATVLIAAVQLVIISGLMVATSLIGERICSKTGLTKPTFMSAHPRMTAFLQILIGSLIMALIIQIPGAGKLPRVGIRIALLLATLGVGGLLKTKFGTQSLISDGGSSG